MNTQEELKETKAIVIMIISDVRTHLPSKIVKSLEEAKEKIEKALNSN